MDKDNILREGHTRKGMTNPDPKGERPNPPKPQKVTNARMSNDTLRAIEIINEILEAMNDKKYHRCFRPFVDTRIDMLKEIINDNKEE